MKIILQKLITYENIEKENIVYTKKHVTYHDTLTEKVK